MKCIYCDSDTTYPVRRSNGGQCGKCHHKFAFEPMTDPLSVSDGLFKRVVKDVSGDGTLFITERQLWYELNRRLIRKLGIFGSCTGSALAVLLGGALLAAAVTLAWPAKLVSLAVLGLGAVAGKPPRKVRHHAPRVPIETFRERYLVKWVATHGAVEKLLSDPAVRPAQPRPITEPDVTSYSFDRALVTDHDETAAMLVANNFHFENNCAILGAGGYPRDIADTVMTMLRRNPQLKVFALHDASIRGCALPRALRSQDWFPDPSIQVIDLGMRPGHVLKMPVIVHRGAPEAVSAELRAFLTAEEVVWLEQGNAVELAALRPAKLMRAVYQGLARANQVGDTGAAGGDTGGVIWIYDGGADVYASDSFG